MDAAAVPGDKESHVGCELELGTEATRTILISATCNDGDLTDYARDRRDYEVNVLKRDPTPVTWLDGIGQKAYLEHKQSGSLEIRAQHKTLPCRVQVEDTDEANVKELAARLAAKL